MKAAFVFLALFAAAAYAQADMEAATDKADSEGLVSAMLRAKWNRTKFDTMDAVTEAQDLDSASEEFMIASLMKRLAALKANKTRKFGDAESADDEFLIRSMLAKLVALKRNKTAVKFTDLESMDETAADEVLLSRVFSTLSAWKAAKLNRTRKFTADAVSTDAADDEIILTRLWTMIQAKKNKTRFAGADFSVDASDDEADAEWMLRNIFNKLAAWKNKTRRADTPDAAEDEFLLNSMLNRLARKNKTGIWRKSADAEGSMDDSMDDEVETNQYFLRRLNKTALATTWNKTALWGNKNKTLLWGNKNKTMWG